MAPFDIASSINLLPEVLLPFIAKKISFFLFFYYQKKYRLKIYFYIFYFLSLVNFLEAFKNFLKLVGYLWLK